MVGFLFRAAIAALGLWLATALVSGLRIDDPQTLILAALLLGVVNAIVRPIAVLLTLPFTLLTLGLFLLVVNAGMVALVAWMLPGMHLAGFGAAFWSAIIVGLTGWIGSAVVGPRGSIQVYTRRDR
jgi:putative membrane protein